MSRRCGTQDENAFVVKRPGGTGLHRPGTRWLLAATGPHMYSDLKIVTGSSNPELAKAICDHLGCQLTPTLATTTRCTGRTTKKLTKYITQAAVTKIKMNILPAKSTKTFKRITRKTTT